MSKLREIVDAMTPGPWRVVGGDVLGPDGESTSDSMLVHGYLLESPHTISSDAEGVVALRNLAPELLAVVEAARDDADAALASRDLIRALDALDRKVAEMEEP